MEWPTAARIDPGPAVAISPGLRRQKLRENKAERMDQERRSGAHRRRAVDGEVDGGRKRGRRRGRSCSGALAEVSASEDAREQGEANGQGEDARSSPERAAGDGDDGGRKRSAAGSFNVRLRGVGGLIGCAHELRGV